MHPDETETVDETPANAPDSDAPQEMLRIQPGQFQIDVTAEGFRFATIPAPIVMRAGRDLTRKMIQDYLREDEGFWDVLIQARVDELHAKKAHLALVTDPRTVKQISKSRNRQA